MQGIRVKKRESQQPDAPSTDAPTPFQIGQAKVKSENAFKQLEFYGQAVTDTEFQRFLSEKVKKLSEMLAVSIS